MGQHEYRIFYRPASAADLKKRKLKHVPKTGDDFIPHECLKGASASEGTESYLPHSVNVELRFAGATTLDGPPSGPVDVRVALKNTDENCHKFGAIMEVPTLEDVDAALEEVGISTIPNRLAVVQVRRGENSNARTFFPPATLPLPARRRRRDETRTRRTKRAARPDPPRAPTAGPGRPRDARALDAIQISHIATRPTHPVVDFSSSSSQFSLSRRRGEAQVAGHKVKIDHGVATVTVKKFRDGGGEPTSLEEVWHTVGAKGDKAAVRAVAATLKAACESLAAEPPAEDPAKVSMKDVVECSTAAFVMKFSQLLRAPYGARKRKAEEAAALAAGGALALDVGEQIRQCIKYVKGNVVARAAVKKLDGALEAIGKAFGGLEFGAGPFGGDLPAKAGKKAKKKRKTKRFGGYQEFCAAQRPNLTDLKMTEQTKVMSERWQALTPAQKAPYETSALAKREAYKKQCAEEDANRAEESDSDGEDDLKARKRKKRKKKKTRRFSPYLSFCAEHRYKYKNESVPEAAKKLGQEWRSLGEKQQKKYKEKAEAAKKEYLAEIAANPPPEPDSDDELLVVKKKKQKTRRFGAWQEFCKELRPKFPKGTKIPEQAKEMAAKWKKLTPKQREKYEAAAVRAREAYNAEVAMAAPQQPVGSLEDTVPPVKMKKQKTK